MYTIYCRLDGTFTCEGMLQDGRETWISLSLAEAVKSLKQFAKVMNNTKIKKSGIAIYQEKRVQQSVWVPVKAAKGRYSLCGDTEQDQEKTVRKYAGG